MATNPSDLDLSEDPSAHPPDTGIEQTDDGGAIIQLETVPPGDEGTKQTKEFYRNLALELDPTVLQPLALELLERIEYDIDSRKPRDDKYAEGIKRTGLGDEAPGGAAFDGASTAVHPMLSKATVFYQSHCINELYPPQGPVRDDVVGAVTPQRVEKAQRKVAHMNWQFRKQMPEFRSQLEKLLSQQPLGGSQYMRLVYDFRLQKPVPTFLPIDDVYIPEAAADFYSAERRTFADHITQHEYDARVRNGIYRDIGSSPPPQIPSKTSAEQATDKAQGKQATPYNRDGLRKIYVTECLAVIEDADDNELHIAGADPNGDPKSKSDPRPYLIEIDPYSREILSIIRNWDREDKTFKNLFWIVDFPFIPWRGAQSVGLIHLAGSLAGAATGSLRALLDTSFVQNMPTLLKLKGSNSPGQTTDFNVCQVNEIDGGVAGDDIRKVIMPVPFNPPSTMLYELLGWCTQEGEALVRTTFENLNDEGAPNMPVGTTLALIEQGLKVLSAIHGRLHDAMNRLLEVLHRINRMYVTDEEILDETGQRLAFRSDYEGPMDVIPVSDPQIFSEIQRFAQLQIIQQRADLHPELYNAYAVEKAILERTKWPDAKQFLKPQPQIHQLNAVNENVALALGQPVSAFPDQDHLAHIQTLLTFGESPLLGSNPLIATKFWPAALQHLAEHMVYWYLTQMVELTSQATGADIAQFTKMKDQGVQSELDKTLAAASPQIMQMAQQAFAKIPQVIQQAQQLLQKFQPQPQPDPTAVATAHVTAQAKAQSDQMTTQAKAQAAERLEMLKQQGQAQLVQAEQQGDDQRQTQELQSRERIAANDNATAMEVAAAKIDTGHSTDLSTGTGMSNEPTGV